MHVLYVHQNFPAQFGHIARHLVNKLSWQCTFVSQKGDAVVDGVQRIGYKLEGGATTQNHYCSRTFENTVWHSEAVYKALKSRPDLRPDLIVGHSGFGSTLFLRELFGATPIINFFEYYYQPHGQHSDMDFRADLGWQVPELNYLRAYCRNAMILLDMQNCDAAYTPTRFQHGRFPGEYGQKLQVIFDGIDRGVYHGHEETLRPPPAQRPPRTLAGTPVPAGMRIVTYVSRGFESMRGFDIFMRAAKLISQRMDNVIFFVVGADRIAYGGDQSHIGGKGTFKQWVLRQEQYDLSRFVFPGLISGMQLAELLAATDLHVYLTVPFVLSWSMMDAMSCGAVVLGSNTAPVKEMIRDGENGLLADFFSPEDFADKAVAVLRDPAAYRPLGRAAEEMVCQHYSLEAVLPRMLQMYQQAITAHPAQRLEVAATPAPTTPPAAAKPRSPFFG